MTIFASNHSGHLDLIFCAAVMPCDLFILLDFCQCVFGNRKALSLVEKPASFPDFGPCFWFLKINQCIPVPVKPITVKKSNLRLSLKEAIAVLKTGGNRLEGRRNEIFSKKGENLGLLISN